MNPRRHFKIKKSPTLRPEELFNKLIQGDRPALSKTITLVESSKPEHKKIAQEIIKRALPVSGNSIRIGITGVPGVGKSTFIESFGLEAIRQGKKVAVLAIDPSSNISGGSILGDKTRMEQLSVEKNAFIRPSPSSGSLGGVARATRESILLCEAAGYDFIIVETVGVGQSETAVHAMVDIFLMLMLANAGDEIQGIKRGIMEMADVLVINKAEEKNKRMAQLAASQIKQALHYFPLNSNQWVPVVETCSALKQINIDRILAICYEYLNHTTGNDSFSAKRKTQSINWFEQTIQEQLTERFTGIPSINEQIKLQKEKITQGETDAFFAADLIIETVLNAFDNRSPN